MKRKDKLVQQTTRFRASGLSLAQSTRMAQAANGTPMAALVGAAAVGVIFIALGAYAGMRQADRSAEPMVLATPVPETDSAPAATVAVETTEPEAAVIEVAAVAEPEPPVEAPVQIADCVADLQPLVSTKRIEFAVGSSEIDIVGRATIEAFATALAACPDAQVVVAGHADASGDPLTNMSLSWARADSAAAVLQEAGIDAGRIQPVGFGSRLPFAEGDATEDDELNRRVDFRVSRIETTRGQ